jgi:hypothetical protein
MKQLLFLFLFLVPCLALAQYPSNGNQKITLGEQTTADGLIYRGVAADTTLTAKSDTAAYFVLDTVNKKLYFYKASATPKWNEISGSGGGGGAGTVTSITGGTGLTGGTITTSGTLAADTNFLVTRFDTTSMLTNYWRSGNFSGTLPIINGGTGSATQNFVDLSNTQTVAGAKTFTSAVTATRFNPTSSTATGTGMFLPAANTLGFSISGTNKMTLDASGNLGVFRVPSNWTNTFRVFQIGTSSYGQNNNTSVLLGTNFVATSTGDKYIENGVATAYQQADGKHVFYTSPSGLKDSILNFTVTMTLKADSELQIAGITDRGAYNLQVNGTGVWGEGAYTNGSDANVKENIVDLDSSLNIVNNLKPVVFNYIKSSVNNDTKHLGFIAQDVYQTLENKDYLGSIVRSDGDTLSIAYSNIIPLLTKAIQEQQAQIEALKQRLLILENK